MSEEQDGGLLDSAAVADEAADKEPESISHVEPTGEQPQQAAPQEDKPEEELTRPDWYPEKFWDEKEGPDLENLSKAYNELLKKFSQGKHKVPENYDDKIFRDANVPEDDELYNTYKTWAKENGVSQSAFEELASKFIEMSKGQAEQMKVSYQEEHKKLGPNADATIKSMTEWAQGLVRKGVWGQDDFEEFKIMGGTADGLRALQKIRSYYGDQTVPVDIGPPAGAPSKDELLAMVGKPEYSSDPAYRAKVEKLFEQVYGGQQYSPA